MTTCEYLDKSGSYHAKNEFETVAKAIFDGTVDDVYDLFAKNVSDQIESLKDDIKKVQDHVDGSYVSNGSIGESSTSLKYDDNWIKYMLLGPQKVYTTTSCYFLNVYYCSIDDFDTNNMGVWNILIKKMEPDEEIRALCSYKDWTETPKYRGITLL